MTQPNDPWAAASATPPPAPPAPTHTPPAYSSPSESLVEAYEAPEGEESFLLSAGQGTTSLFNKTHFVGTERTGIITGMRDRQDVDHANRSPKFWSDSKTGGEKGNSAITTDPVDKITGAKNKPVMCAHIMLDTDHRMTAQEAQAVNPKRTAEEAADIAADDDGSRVLVIKNASEQKAFTKAVNIARRSGVPITNTKSLNGLRIYAKRAGQVPNNFGTMSWVMEYRIERA